MINTSGPEAVHEPVPRTKPMIMAGRACFVAVRPEPAAQRPAAMASAAGRCERQLACVAGTTR
jgi:hypothetical protein